MDDEFSFSGLKTAVLRLIQTFKGAEIPINDICASFQETITSTLIKKTVKMARRNSSNTIVIAGGVAANSRLREKLYELENDGFKVYAPKMKYCTDNASMVASCAYFNPIKTDNPLEFEVFSRG